MLTDNNDQLHELTFDEPVRSFCYLAVMIFYKCTCTVNLD
jgi:hypothetical protein